ncbi:MAG: AEC family transporter, partial [Clostridiales bacterium]|nr:AEC family transporter [Clostridiales bacterium]
MDHFIVSLNAVMPTFLLMAAGFLLRHLGIVSAEFLKQANKVTFSVFLPVMLFRNIYPTDLSETFDVAVVFMALGCLVILFFILWFTVPHVVHDPKRQGVVMQGIFRSNYLIFGVSI